MNFRKDINGLRAWAVVAVVLYHFKLLHFSGGFTGVDIFFVISGFLMTGIITSKIESGTFSVVDFYLARARRILPALVGLVIILFIFGYFFLPAFLYRDLGKEIRFSLSFLSNFFLWQSSGYFDTSSHEKWLLHTWSLSVEWQFYVLFPLYLVGTWFIAHRIKTKDFSAQMSFFLSITVLLVASLCCSFATSSSKPEFSFYLLPARMWELLAGGLTFLIHKKYVVSANTSRILHVLGAVLLAASFLLFSQKMSWPSGWALVPVVAISLLLFAHRDSCLTNTGIAQWLGDRSYSIYLYHWPFAVILYYSGFNTSLPWIFASIICSVIFAHLSYLLIENPLRFQLKKIDNKPKQIILVCCLVCIGLAGPLAIKSEIMGLESDRLVSAIQEVEPILDEQNNRSPHFSKMAMIDRSNNVLAPLYGEDEIGAILVGDSHAHAVVSAFGVAATKFGKGVLYMGKDGCPIIEGLSTFNAEIACAESTQSVVKKVKAMDAALPVVIVNRTSYYVIGGNEERMKDEPQGFFSRVPRSNKDFLFHQEFEQSFIKTVCDLAQERPVYIVSPIPEMGVDVPQTLAKRIFRGDDKDILISKRQYYLRHKLVYDIQNKAVEQCGAKVLSPISYLCDDDNCYGSKNGKPLYFDDDHMSEYGNKLLVPMFEKVFADETIPTSTAQAVNEISPSIHVN